MGLDSLTSMELRNRLQQEFSCSLATTLVFKYPTVESLADYLLAEVFRPSANEPGAALPTTEDIRLAERVGASERETKGLDLAALSEEEAEALLLAQLEQLNF